MSDDGVLYERVAERVATLIERGALRPGEKAPSVRRLAAEQRVSIATALRAYVVLEGRGLLETRPQSGHYVRALPAATPLEPRCPERASSPARVSVGALAAEVIDAMGDPAIVPLGCAVPSPAVLPLAAIRRSLARVARTRPATVIAYERAPGVPELRRQLARRSVSFGAPLAPADIVTTTGGMEALTLCLRAVAKPGDVVAIESPAFFGILQAIEGLDMRALELPSHPRDGVTPETLAEALGPARGRRRVAAVILTPSFANPIGSCMPDAARREVVRLLARRGIPLIEDDIYGDLSHDGLRPRPAKAYDEEGLVLLCSSFSKSLAPGLRLGWCAPGRFKDAVAAVKLTSTLACATLPQLALADLLESGVYDRHLRRLRPALRSQVASVARAVARGFPEGTRVSRPAGGLVLWVELPRGVDGGALYRRAREARIGIAPGPLFTTTGRFKGYIRLSCGSPFDARIEGAVATLGRMATEMAVAKGLSR